MKLKKYAKIKAVHGDMVEVTGNSSIDEDRCWLWVEEKDGPKSKKSVIIGVQLNANQAKKLADGLEKFINDAV